VAVNESVAAWAERDGCEPQPSQTQVGDHVMLIEYTGCADDASVQFYSVSRGGHTWPGAIDVPRLGPVTDEIDATDLILDFFDEH
jgi:polyhydroxybutyrate depolymerase